MCGAFFMRKITMNKTITAITFEEGCNKYLERCVQRNLRAHTIQHYRNCYVQYFKFFDPQMPLSEFSESTLNEYILHIQSQTSNSITLKTYLLSLSTTLKFLMREGYMEEFPLPKVKSDKKPIDTYTDDELKILLKKPNLKECTFLEYQCWVMTNMFFSTGVRRHSIINIRISDLDLKNRILTLAVTKNRKTLLVPLSQTMVNILNEYLQYRQHDSEADYLFCNSFGNKHSDDSINKAMYKYNIGRGVTTTGLHRFRHTFAKQFILNGGNVVVLSKLLGHSTLDITQNYINLLTSDAQAAVDEINLLDKFAGQTKIKMR